MVADEGNLEKTLLEFDFRRSPQRKELYRIGFPSGQKVAVQNSLRPMRGILAFSNRTSQTPTWGCSDLTTQVSDERCSIRPIAEPHVGFFALASLFGRPIFFGRICPPG
jgi:hypothetical protein